MAEMKNKLLRVERAIEVHDLNGDNVREIQLDISLNELLNIITPNDDDPDLYDGYLLQQSQLLKLSLFSSCPLRTLPTETYFLTATGIYEW